MPASPVELTQLLNRLGQGDPSVEDEVLDRLYGELRVLAGAQLRGRESHTLQPTALVHEAWMRLVDVTETAFESRRAFFKLVSRAMRSVLVDHHRKKTAGKRGGNALQITFVDHLDGSEDSALDVLELDEALGRLDEQDPELAQVVEMRFFGGLSLPEISDAIDVPQRTLERRWKLARAWLHAELTR